jgi:hypothetical protein
MTKKLLTLENIRSGAVPSDAVAVGFLLGEIERLDERLETQKGVIANHIENEHRSHEPGVGAKFPEKPHPLGKLTNLICDVIEHARDSSPHSDEFESLVQTMWDEYNAKLLTPGASRDEPGVPHSCATCGFVHTGIVGASRETSSPCPSVHDHIWAADGHCMRCYAQRTGE